MSQIKGRICLKEVIGFLKMSPSLHKWLAAETRLADKEFSQAAVNREESLKLRRRNSIPVISKKWVTF